MSVLDQIAKGGRYSGLDIAQAGTQGASDAQALQMKAMKMQAFTEASEIKRKAREAMKNADLSTVESTRETAQKLIDAGDLETGIALDKEADNQEYRSQKLALDKRKLDLIEQSYKLKEKLAMMKNTGNAKFKRATIAQTKSTGAMLVNDDTFNNLEDAHKTDYAAHITQSVADYMEAARAAKMPVTGTQAFDAVSRFAQAYVIQEGRIFGAKMPWDNDKFEAEAFRKDFMEGLPSMLGYSQDAVATSAGIVVKEDTQKDEVKSYIDTIIGSE